MTSHDSSTTLTETQLNIATEILTTTEQTELAENESVIERGLKTFHEVGNALIAIRDKRLYRQTFKTFEDYCQQKWGLGERRAYQFIDAAKVLENLKSEPMVQLPASERQARPLTQLEPEAQRVVWDIVQKTAPNGKVTADHVKSVTSVFKEVATTKAIDDGSGVQVAVSDVFKAAVTEETYERMKRQEAYIAQKLDRKKEKKEEKATAKASIPANLPIADERFTLHMGDLVDIMPTMEAASIDAIITDPPYPREFLPVYLKLAQQAARVLKPGGSLLVMVGQSYLPEILEMMSPIIQYNWMLTYLTPGGQAAQLWDRHVNTFWKPVLWFTNGKYTGDWIGDVLKSEANDKNFHHWGQSESGMADIIERFTYPGQKILDPFVGGGTTATVALKMNRLFVGIDIDQKAIDTTRARIAADVLAVAA